MKLVILDRDGVINEDSDAYIKTPDEWLPIPGSVEAIARLNHAGFTVTVATNQSGIARGLFDLDALSLIHKKLHKHVARAGGHIDGVFFCPHGPEDNCDCRKPRPGLLDKIGNRFGVSLAGVPVIGDSLRDLEAALVVGAQPILVRTGKGLRTEPMLVGLETWIPVFDDLAAAVDHLVPDER